MVIANRVKQSPGKQGIASLGAQFVIAFLSSIDYTCYISFLVNEPDYFALLSLLITVFL
jgi:hypothetical protein